LILHTYNSLSLSLSLSHGITSLLRGGAIAEHVLLNVAELLQKVTEAIKAYIARVREIRAPGRQEAGKKKI
jgi:hypothetical protein